MQLSEGYSKNAEMKKQKARQKGERQVKIVKSV